MRNKSKRSSAKTPVTLVLYWGEKNPCNSTDKYVVKYAAEEVLRSPWWEVFQKKSNALLSEMI